MEGGQCGSPLRPAAGVGSRRAHRCIPRQNGCVAAAAAAKAPSPGPAQESLPAKAIRCADRKLCNQPVIACAPFRTPEVTRSPARNPPPPPGGEDYRAGHLPRWPCRLNKCPKGRAAMGLDKVRATAGFAQPDLQEKCLALVRIGTRKHWSAGSPELRWVLKSECTGGSAEARGTSCEIKALLSRTCPWPSRCRRHHSRTCK